MSAKIALAGNPNSGKTTLFNALTGSNQFVGNWPGVTVEKKEGKLKGSSDVTITDLPGIYSLSPYTLEEVVARNYLLNESPDVILNIVDGSNLERNLYLTTQLLELGIPVVIAVNMMDIVEKNGDKINLSALSNELGCEVCAVSAIKGTGIKEAAQKAVDASKNKTAEKQCVKFGSKTEGYIEEIISRLGSDIPEDKKRFYAIKLFERDDKISELMKNPPDVDDIIKTAEAEADDDSESIITNERYNCIASLVKKCYNKNTKNTLSLSDKIDRIVTNRFAALPIFAAVMFIVYYVSVTTVGTWVTDWANDGVFGEGWSLFGIDIPGIPVIAENALEAAGCSKWLCGLILDGIIGGVGAVLGFVPQMLVLFAFLAFLEGCGYMARIAFIMDRIFRRFGLSGKSFIPMLIGSGCGVPGIMASRTIENDRDRRMTIITTTFIPCGAKLPIIALIAGALFNGAWWVAPSAYFVGIAAIIVSGIILKKTRMFEGDPAPFVMELPRYHMPTFGNVMRSMWERGWSFIKKAGTIILLSTIVLWFLMGYGFGPNGFGAVELEDSILAYLGNAIAWIFTPLGWTQGGQGWKMAVAAVTGLIAKENVVASFGMLFGFAEVAEDGAEIWASIAECLSAPAAYSFLVFNLLCAPCFAAIGAIRREMNSAKWTWFAVGYQTVFAYAASMCIYNIGSLFSGLGFSIGTAASFAVCAVFVWLVARPHGGNSVLKSDGKILLQQK